MKKYYLLQEQIIPFPLNKLWLILPGSLFVSVACASEWQTGMSVRGTTGGLAIPSASVLNNGDITISYSDYYEPILGKFPVRNNYTLGFGLLPNIELVGRFTNYQIPRKVVYYGRDVHGPRDLSANIKWRLPLEHFNQPEWTPDIALGVTDIKGGTGYYHATYAVASQRYDWLGWTLGYGKTGQNKRNQRALDGMFGGLELRLLDTPVSVLAETDAAQKHIGARYASDPISWLANGRVVASLQHSVGENYPNGQDADRTSYNITLNVPLFKTAHQQNWQTQSERTLLAIKNSPQGDIADVLNVLLRSGMDRVRVGRLDKTLVVDYENQTYLHNEVDALGIVLALASELAPASLDTILVRSLKSGQVTSHVRTNIAAYRTYLRDNDISQLHEKITFSLADASDLANVKWETEAQTVNKVRFELSPVLNYTVGTEFGDFDYSWGANLRTKASLWRGAEIYGDLVTNVSDSDSMKLGEVFEDRRVRNGVSNIALQQSLWQGNRVYTSVGIGKYNYDYYGTEGQTIAYLPWSGDAISAKAAYYKHEDNNTKNEALKSGTVAYRKAFADHTWLEAAYNRYTDKSSGPSLQLTRWFDDTSISLYAHKSMNTFAGIRINMPLTPRKGMSTHWLQIQGTNDFDLALRTRMSDRHQRKNFLMTNSTRPLNLNYQVESERLNLGRITPEYFIEQLPRMRESFFTHARNLLAN